MAAPFLAALFQWLKPFLAVLFLGFCGCTVSVPAAFQWLMPFECLRRLKVSGFMWLHRLKVSRFYACGVSMAAPFIATLFQWLMPF